MIGWYWFIGVFGRGCVDIDDVDDDVDVWWVIVMMGELVIMRM